MICLLQKKRSYDVFNYFQKKKDRRDFDELVAQKREGPFYYLRFGFQSPLNILEVLLPIKTNLYNERR